MLQVKYDEVLITLVLLNERSHKNRKLAVFKLIVNLKIVNSKLNLLNIKQFMFHQLIISMLIQYLQKSSLKGPALLIVIIYLKILDGQYNNLFRHTANQANTYLFEMQLNIGLICQSAIYVLLV